MGDDDPRGTIVVSLAGLTHVGLVREAAGDTFRITSLGAEGDAPSPQEVRERRPLGAGLVLGVYDGSGDGGLDERASALVARTIHAGLAGHSLPAGEDELRDHLDRVVRGAHVALEAEPGLRGAGCTATVMGVMGPTAVIAQVGDGRGYLLRGRRCLRVTSDKQWTNRDPDALPEPVDMALGVSADLEPAFTRVSLRRGDVIMLCTDGLTGLVSEPLIRAVLLRQRDPGVACRVLRDEALRAGGYDNVTIVIARFDGEGLLPPIRAEEPSFAT